MGINKQKAHLGSVHFPLLLKEGELRKKEGRRKLGETWPALQFLDLPAYTAPHRRYLRVHVWLRYMLSLDMILFTE